uniref:Uncharacterized protein n=1 Tax=Frankia torreyi TaxID=1856 RepID=Q9AEZ1_9ACTN|nr:hypothetical protein [Frankia torreyi]
MLVCDPFARYCGTIVTMPSSNSRARWCSITVARLHSASAAINLALGQHAKFASTFSHIRIKINLRSGLPTFCLFAHDRASQLDNVPPRGIVGEHGGHRTSGPVTSNSPGIGDVQRPGERQLPGPTSFMGAYGASTRLRAGPVLPVCLGVSSRAHDHGTSASGQYRPVGGEVGQWADSSRSSSLTNSTRSDGITHMVTSIGRPVRADVPTRDNSATGSAVAMPSRRASSRSGIRIRKVSAHLSGPWPASSRRSRYPPGPVSGSAHRGASAMPSGPIHVSATWNGDSPTGDVTRRRRTASVHGGMPSICATRGGHGIVATRGRPWVCHGSLARWVAGMM